MTKSGILAVMKTVLVAGLSFLLFPLAVFALGQGDYTPESVGAGAPELHINANGTMSVRSARVDQIAGTTLYLILKWGQMPMHFTMKTDEKTNVVKRYGGVASVGQIKIGDYIDADGDFFVGSDFFGLTAKTLKDWSQTEEAETFSGKIIEMNASVFVLETPRKNIIVESATSTVIRKGSVTIPWSRLAKGDTIVLADGVYDYAKNTLSASQLIVFQSKADFTPKNFEGKLTRIESTSLPTTLVVTVGGVEYSVYLTSSTQILTKNKKPALLGRFVVGDTLRFYGAVKESDKTLADQLVVPAEIVRNLSL